METSKMSLTQKLSVAGLMTALVMVATLSIRIPIPFTSGYIHPGDSIIFIAGLVLGGPLGGLAAGIGSMFADIFGGYPSWALPTLVIKFIMGYGVGFFAKNITIKKTLVLAVVVILAWIGFVMYLDSQISSVIADNRVDLLVDVDGADTIDDAVGLRENLIKHSIIVPLLVIAFSILLERNKSKGYRAAHLLSMFLGGIVMIVGYFVAANILYGSLIASVFSVPANIVQFGIGIVLSYVLIIALKRTKLNIID